MVSSRGRLVALLVLLAVLIYLPSVLYDRAVFGYQLSNIQLLGLGINNLNAVFIGIMAALAMDLLMGYAGIFSVGHAAFFILGAMTAAQLDLKWGASFPVVVVAATLLGAAIGALIGLISLKLRHIYMLMSTLALHFIAIFIFLEYQRSSFGVAGIQFASPSIGPFTVETEVEWYFVLLASTVLVLLACRNLVAMREGRALLAIRDREAAAASLGMNVAAVKIRVFAISSAIVSFTGVLYAYSLTAVTDETFNLTLVIGFVAMIVIGGMGSLLGAVIGAMVWTLSPQIFATLTADVPASTPVIGEVLTQNQPQIVAALLGVTVILILLFRPAGLAGVYQATRRRVTLWPYST